MSQFPVGRTPRISIDFGDANLMALEQIPNFRRPAMNKLRAKFNWSVAGRIMHGEDSAANAVASFENRYPEAGFSQSHGSCNSRCARANHDHIWILRHMRKVGRDNPGLGSCDSAPLRRR